jgi:hypothetical protein
MVDEDEYLAEKTMLKTLLSIIARKYTTKDRKDRKFYIKDWVHVKWGFTLSEISDYHSKWHYGKANPILYSLTALVLNNKVYYQEDHLYEETRGLVYFDVKQKEALFDEDTSLLKMKCVAKLPAGTVFGEKGLDENVPRSATCICVTDCHFGVIQKKDYIKVLKEVSRL